MTMKEWQFKGRVNRSTRTAKLSVEIQTKHEASDKIFVNSIFAPAIGFRIHVFFFAHFIQLFHVSKKKTKFLNLFHPARLHITLNCFFQWNYLYGGKLRQKTGSKIEFAVYSTCKRLASIGILFEKYILICVPFWNGSSSTSTLWMTARHAKNSRQW